MGEPTPGPWEYACDSYGKVRHSKKACVYANVKGDGGDRLETVASQIANWDDARLIHAAHDMLAALQELSDALDEATECLDIETNICSTRLAKARDAARAAVAKATGEPS